MLPKDSLEVDNDDTNKNEEVAKKILTGIAFFVVIIGIIGFRTYQISGGMDLHILNGFTETCTIEFEDGKIIKVEGNSHDKVSLSAGEYEVTINKPNAKTYTKTFSLKQKSYVKSFFGYENVFVLNPYKGATVERAEVVYAVKHARNYGDVDSYYFVGSDFWVFDQCDYPFEEMPDEISMEGNSETRTGMIMHTYEEAQVTYLTDYLIEEKVPRQHVLKLLETHIKNSFLNITTISKYVKLAIELKKDIKWIDKIADQHIDDINFQRYYQSILSSQYGEEYVVKKYQNMLKKDSENPNLLYLTGRLLPDNNEVLKHFEKALKIDSEHAYANYGIGYNKMMFGEFEEAKKLFEKANKFDPESTTISSALYNSKLATKEYDELINSCTDWNGSEWRSYDFYNLIELYNLNGKKKEATNELVKYHKRCNKEVAKDYLREYKTTAMVYNSYYAGDKKQMKSAAEKVQNKYEKNYYKFNYCLWCNQPNSAEMMLKACEMENSSNSLLLYISYMRAGNKTKAQKCLKDCINYYQKVDDYDYKNIAKILQGKESYRTLVQKAKEITIDFNTKHEILVALAIIYPYQKNDLLSLAEKFNYSLEMPHNFIKDSIKDLRLKKL